jgi:hypothetical protein
MDYLTSNLKVAGTRPIRPDGVDKVIGRAVFAAETRAAGMLWGKIKRSPRARCADHFIRGGKPARRSRAETQHGPADVAREERREERHESALRCQPYQHRLRAGVGRGEEPSALENTSEGRPRPRHRMRFLVQRRGRIQPENARMPWRTGGLSLLYVGGRPNQVAHPRSLSESRGAELLYHDGGIEHHPDLLAGLTSRADIVLFPVDCVSHDAALMVKRLCRRTNKRFIPLRSASASSFLAALRTLAKAASVA